MKDSASWRHEPRTGEWIRADGAVVMLVTCRWQALSPSGDASLLRESAHDAMAAADRAWPAEGPA